MNMTVLQSESYPIGKACQTGMSKIDRIKNECEYVKSVLLIPMQEPNQTIF